MTGTQTAEGGVTRRTVVAAAGTAGLGAALVACGGGSSSANGTSSASSASGTSGASSPSGSSGPSDEASGGGDVLAKTADIPEGGGKIFADRKVVVTQPKANEFKAFSAVCTHQGCTVASITDGVIKCPCHGSEFSIADGSVKGGPAPSPLPPEQIKVSGGSISLA
ncbi:Rieske (2Fe-2S) protein [Streptomyces montanisoli]|uniref:Cytochrome bc1 complex Rieske iron-sulfur subunit n=1 Tax=Streptomyces montanisoli TaxID=2798581 RepID=A0A940MD46_9ACTN|nr:Rieske (2Fe-2S) protein [Streptomyces montanisoli]MBP0458186.1 Rieske (2Fe-2S) protein [Streptomyces montanisoli]